MGGRYLVVLPKLVAWYYLTSVPRGWPGQPLEALAPGETWIASVEEPQLQ